MTSTQQSTGESLMAGVFASVQHAAHAIDGLLATGADQALLGVLMSDRTAQRHFEPPNARNELGSASAFSPNVNRLAAALGPMAALGTPGSGLVAAGPLAASLVAAGLGSRAGLELALRALEIAPDQAREVAYRVKNGSVLVGVLMEHSDRAERLASLMQNETSIPLQLHVNRPLTHATLVTRPQAPAIEAAVARLALETVALPHRRSLSRATPGLDSRAGQALCRDPRAWVTPRQPDFT